MESLADRPLINRFIIGLHVTFWILHYVINFYTIQLFTGHANIALFQASVTLLVHMAMVYFNLGYLQSKFLFKQRIPLYIFLSTLVIALAIVTRHMISLWLEESLHTHGKLPEGKIVLMSISAFMTFIFTSPFRFIREWFLRIRLEERLRTQKLEAELRFLKAQVNPHFLFNVLNNIYSMVYIGSEKAGPTILKLSDMMRYMLYECQAEQVPLRSEVEYLEHFIELQEQKFEGRIKTVFEIGPIPEGLMVPPLLFIPFFENAFKHGAWDHPESGEAVQSALQVEGKVIRFQINNPIAIGKRKHSVGGVGLENIRHRLELLFPRDYMLDIRVEDERFSVELEMNLEGLVLVKKDEDEI